MVLESLYTCMNFQIDQHKLMQNLIFWNLSSYTWAIKNQPSITIYLEKNQI
jgi:hypothetical protein